MFIVNKPTTKHCHKYSNKYSSPIDYRHSEWQQIGKPASEVKATQLGSAAPGIQSQVFLTTSTLFLYKYGLCSNSLRGPQLVTSRAGLACGPYAPNPFSQEHGYEHRLITGWSYQTRFSCLLIVTYFSRHLSVVLIHHL